MKNFCITFLLLIIIFLTAGCQSVTSVSKAEEKTEFLRIHVRANSNSEEDQKVKYCIKEEIVKYLTPHLAQCHTKNDAAIVIAQKSKTLEYIIDGILQRNGFDYSSRISIKNEKFPTRVYQDFTLESGYYDAVIVELGEAKGDNWWCVVYPPLCFTGGENVKYSSLILQIIEEFKQRFC